MLIYKIFRGPEWAQMQRDGHSAGAPVDLADGYVHLSTARQVPETLSRHFAGQHGLILLACDGDLMGPDLRWQPSRGGALFPHLYRRLRLTDVAWHRQIQPGHQTGPLA